MNIKILLCAIVLSASSQHCFGEYLKVYEANGTVKVITLDDANIITFNDNQMNVGNHIFDMGNLIKYEFSDNDGIGVGIMSVTGDITGFCFDSRGIITVPDAIELHDVHIYLTNGIECSYKIIGNSIDISDLDDEIYLVKIGNISFKYKKG